MAEKTRSMVVETPEDGDVGVCSSTDRDEDGSALKVENGRSLAGPTRGCSEAEAIPLDQVSSDLGRRDRWRVEENPEARLRQAQGEGGRSG